MSEAAWVVAQTHNNASGRAEDNLLRQGFEFYNPKHKERVLVRGRQTFRVAQLFHGYLFVLITDRWRVLLSTFGVSNLLMASAEKPAVIAPEIISELRSREGKDGLIQLDKSKFRVGQRVQIKSGPYAYEFGLYEKQLASDRVMVLLSWCSATVREDNLVAV